MAINSVDIIYIVTPRVFATLCDAAPKQQIRNSLSLYFLISFYETY